VAWIVKRKRKDGTPVLRVAWRDKNTGKPQSETFLAAERERAYHFLRHVEAAGNRWPAGYVPGRGWPTDDPNPSGFTVRTACLKAIEVNRKALPGTKADYVREVDRYLPEGDPLASMYVEDVAVEDIEEWHTRLEAMLTQPGGPEKSKRTTTFHSKPLSAKTRMHAHSRLSAGLALMVRRRLIPTNLSIGLGPHRGGARKKQALTPQEYLALRAFVPESYLPFVDTLARTGMRFSEATALTVRHFTFAGTRGLISVEQAWKRTEQFGTFETGDPKTARGTRKIPMDRELIEVIKPLLARKKAQDLVFVTAWGNAIRHNNFHSRYWRPLALEAFEAGVVSFVPTIHDLRHAHASWLLSDGVPVHVVADRLGHDPAVLLRTYAHLMTHAAEAAAMAVERLLVAGPGEDGIATERIVPGSSASGRGPRRGRRSTRT